MTAAADQLMALCLDFASFIDAGQARRAADLFADDGVLVSRGERIAGRAALLARFEARERRHALVTRHALSNISLRLDGAHGATGSMLMTVSRREGPDGPVCVSVADVHDVYACDALGRWRIAQRRIDLVFAP